MLGILLKLAAYKANALEAVLSPWSQKFLKLEKASLKIIANRIKGLNLFSLTSEIRQIYSFSPLLFDIVLDWWERNRK